MDEVQDINFSGGALFHWEEGKPVPKKGKTRRTMSKTQLEQTLFAGGSLPYMGEWDPKLQMWNIDPSFDGLTNFEVAAIRLNQIAASGNLKAIEIVLDRTLGKPKQQIESVTARMTYAEYLDMLANEEAKTQTDIVIETEALAPNAFYDKLADDEDLESLVNSL